MASLVTAVFKYSIGALISKGRSMAAEKLKDGDVTDAKLRQLIVKDMDDIKSKLEGISVKDLGASISFFNHGVVYLGKVLDKDGLLGAAEKSEVRTEADGATKKIKVKENDIVPLAKGVKSLHLVGLNEDAKRAIKEAEKKFEDARQKAIEAFSNPALSTADRSLAMAIRISFSIVPLTKGVKSLNLVGLNEDAKSAIKRAEKRFEEASKKAIEAFSNPALSTADRLLAMAIRIMATVLEQVGNPVSALDSLRYCLEELHSLSAVQENFSVLLKKGFKSIFGKDQRNEIVAFVCQMNRLIYDLTHEFVEDGRMYRQLFLWPSVEVGGEKIDLLRDARIAKELRGMDMEQCCVQPWSFGPQRSEEFMMYSLPSDIATNTKGQFIVSHSGKVILFDSGGNFVYSFPIPASGKHIRGVETDQADNMYVLVEPSGLREYHGFIYMFDAQAKLHHQFKFKKLRRHTVHSLILDSTGNVLVSMKQYAKEPSDEKYYHAHEDRFKIELTVQVFSKTGERLNSVDVLCHKNSSCLCTIREERVLVLDDRYSTLHSVGIKDNADHEKIQLKGEGVMSPRVMKFHQPSELLFILSVSYDNSPRVSMYSKDGEYVRTIPLNVRIEFTPLDSITTAFAVTNDGHFAYLLQRRMPLTCEEPPVVYVI